VRCSHDDIDNEDHSYNFHTFDTNALQWRTAERVIAGRWVELGNGNCAEDGPGRKRAFSQSSGLSSSEC
jgi:hypothetical protein